MSVGPGAGAGASSVSLSDDQSCGGIPTGIDELELVPEFHRCHWRKTRFLRDDHLDPAHCQTTITRWYGSSFLALTLTPAHTPFPGCMPTLVPAPMLTPVPAPVLAKTVPRQTCWVDIVIRMMVEQCVEGRESGSLLVRNNWECPSSLTGYRGNAGSNLFWMSMRGWVGLSLAVFAKHPPFDQGNIIPWMRCMTRPVLGQLRNDLVEI